mmetsp:Transcript_58641/g.153610  ORF Transcript_58641/g.153610 Transcript_58641/m.153610 type:complete len:610 (-) Transcript_58641:89-1918(-)
MVLWIVDVVNRCCIPLGSRAAPRRRAASRSPAGLGLAETRHPALAVFLGVEGRGVGVAAVHALAHAVTNQIEHVGPADAQLVQALAHEVVLAPSLPPEAVEAFLLAHEEVLHRQLREDLNGAEHHGVHTGFVAVHDVGVLAVVRQQLGAKPAREKHRVGIYLQRPIGVDVLAGRKHLLPDAEEELGVARSVVHGSSDISGLESDGINAANRTEAQVEAHHRLHDVVVGRGMPVRRRRAHVGGGAENRELFASEDARALGHLVPHEVRLIAFDPDHRETEERGRRPRPGRTRAQLLARPSRGVEVAVLAAALARAAIQQARRPTGQLLVALHARCLAALRLRAATVIRCAGPRDPSGDIASRHNLGLARCARTDGLATPRLAVDIEDVGPWMALGLALTDTLGLQKALVTGLAAALRFSAIVGARGADILDPIGHEVGPIERRRGGRCSGAEGVAIPRLVAPRLGRVEAQSARRLALRPEVVALVALRAGLGTAFSVAAVRTVLCALPSHPRRSHRGAWAQDRASPRIGVRVCQVDALGASDLAHGPAPNLLLVALCAWFRAAVAVRAILAGAAACGCCAGCAGSELGAAPIATVEVRRIRTNCTGGPAL